MNCGTQSPILRSEIEFRPGHGRVSTCVTTACYWDDIGTHKLTTDIVWPFCLSNRFRKMSASSIALHVATSLAGPLNTPNPYHRMGCCMGSFSNDFSYRVTHYSALYADTTCGYELPYHGQKDGQKKCYWKQNMFWLERRRRKIQMLYKISFICKKNYQYVYPNPNWQI